MSNAKLIEDLRNFKSRDYLNDNESREMVLLCNRAITALKYLEWHTDIDTAPKRIFHTSVSDRKYILGLVDGYPMVLRWFERNGVYGWRGWDRELRLPTHWRCIVLPAKYDRGT